MPFFGIDDVLFLVASTTALLWVKRGDFARESLTGLLPHSLEGKGPDTGVALLESKLCQNPRLLLRGFKLDDADDERRTSVRSPLPHAAALVSHVTPRAGELSTSSDLVRKSVVSELQEVPLVGAHYSSRRHRNAHKPTRWQLVEALAESTEQEVSQSVRQYSIGEVRSLFDKLEREQQWESVITVSRGIELANVQLKHLSQANVEAALRTLFAASKPDLAVAYYLSYGEDMLPADPLVVALFDACRHAESVAVKLLNNLMPLRPYWSTTVYACCLTTAARVDCDMAVQLYGDYMVRFHSQQGNSSGARRDTLSSTTSECRTGGLARVFSSPSILFREGGFASVDNDDGSSSTTAPATATEPKQLQYLYHIIVPLVLQTRQENAAPYLHDMMQNEPGEAPDVLLRCLVSSAGRLAARKYVQFRRKSRHLGDEAVYREGMALFGGPTTSLEGEANSSEERLPLDELVLELYRLRPSAMNMNSLLQAVLQMTLGGQKSSLAPDEALSVASLSDGKSTQLQSLFLTVPLPSGDADAAILARSLMERSAPSPLTAQFLTAMTRRKVFAVVPPLATHLARQGEWSAAATAMSVYLSNQRNTLTPTDVSFCVEAAVKSGRWSSALFWVDRAHEKGLALPKETYDSAFMVSQHCLSEAVLRAFQGMHKVGGTCSDRGVLSILEAAAKQGKIVKAMGALAKTGLIRWVH